ncbi:hypothetical protein [Rhodococcus sp. KRD162]|uniref:hypothetical protein n=1 Tax=Rhodococcus sp. KRD162 TaxID=2729725 RepID=UPI0019D0A9EB|nr:hypothetical protein [Rhodococcus sp. KRD162]
MATKIVGAASATLVNAVVPALIHQSTESPESGRKFLRFLWIGLGPIAFGSSVAAFTWFRDFAAPVVIVGLWLICATTAAVAQRMTFRFLPPSASRLTMASVSLVAVVAIASSRSSNFDVNVLLAAYASVEALTGMLLLFALRIRLLGFYSMLCVLFLAGAWAGSLTSP